MDNTASAKRTHSKSLLWHLYATVGLQRWRHDLEIFSAVHMCKDILGFECFPQAILRVGKDAKSGRNQIQVNSSDEQDLRGECKTSHTNKACLPRSRCFVSSLSLSRCEMMHVCHCCRSASLLTYSTNVLPQLWPLSAVCTYQKRKFSLLLALSL